MTVTRYRTFWRRFWAGIFDGLLFLPFEWAMDVVWSKDLSSVPSVVWFFVSYFSFSIYVVAMHGRFGQTVGKMITGVTVLREDNEESISYRQSFIRESPYIAILLIGWIAVAYYLVTNSGLAEYQKFDLLLGYVGLVWFFLEIVTMLFNNKRRALHDFIAGTVVVRGD